MNTFKILIFLLSCHTVCAQETLTLEQSIETALVNNNLIEISNLETKIAYNDISLGNAGYLPTVNLVTGNTLANNNVHQELFNGTVIDRNGARQTNLNGNIVFNWVVFEGFRRNHMYHRLKKTYEKAEVQNKVAQENIISDVSRAYFTLLQQLEILAAYESTLLRFEDRLRLAEARYDNGLGAKSDVLLSKVDINSQKAILLRQRTLAENSKIEFNRLLNRDVKTAFLLAPKAHEYLADTSAYTSQATSLESTEKDIVIARAQYCELAANYYPRLGFGTGYLFSQVQSQAGQLLLNRNGGLNLGLNLSWSLFDGFNKNRLRNTAKYRIEISRLAHEENKQTQAALYQNWIVQYRNALKTLVLETESAQLAQQSNDLAKQRYQNGNINLFEYKETQKVLEDSKIRQANAKFEALMAEVELKRLQGRLLIP